MKTKKIELVGRVLMGAGLVLAGIGHLTFVRKEFQAQVPDWVPLKKDDTVVLSGFAEIALGGALLFAPKKYRKCVGQLAATMFVAVFPGNIAQYLNKRNAFGLNTDKKRFARLLFQPVLVYGALKSTGNFD